MLTQIVVWILRMPSTKRDKQPVTKQKRGAGKMGQLAGLRQLVFTGTTRKQCQNLRQNRIKTFAPTMKIKCAFHNARVHFSPQGRGKTRAGRISRMQVTSLSKRSFELDILKGRNMKFRFLSLALLAGTLTFAGCEEAKDAADSAKDATAETVDAAAEGAGDAADATAEAAGDAVDAAKEAAGDAVVAAKETAGDMKNAAAEKIGDGADAVKEAVGQ